MPLLSLTQKKQKALLLRSAFFIIITTKIIDNIVIKVNRFNKMFTTK